MPRYDFGCQGCGQTHEYTLSYDTYDQIQAGRPDEPPGHIFTTCAVLGYRCLQRLLPPAEMPGVHLKGYGFTTTDNRSPDERFMFDHYDGSGRNPEMKAIQRRIKHPDSTLPSAPNRAKG